MILTKRTAILLIFSGVFCVSSVSAQDSNPGDAEAKSEAKAAPESTDKPATDSPQAAKTETSADSSKTGQTKPQEDKAQDETARPDFRTGKLKIEFKNTEWGKVIRWFADEAKLDLNMAVTPEGSFNYSSNGEFTLLQTMDVINSFLIREQGYILLRHANLIIVHDLNNEIPPTMIETISESELDSRGEYELTQAEFSVKGFDGGKFSSDIERLIREDQGGKQMLIESSEVLFVRETGGRLRLIRKYLEMAKSIAGFREQNIKIAELKFITPEEVMTVATELIPLDDENSFNDDESGEKLKVVVQSFGNKFILQGTSKTMARFTSLIDLLDKESKIGEAAVGLAQPVTKRYPISADRELNLQVLRTMLAGTEGLRLALAEEAGEIIAYATPEVHEAIQKILDSLQSDASDFQVIRLNDYDADSMIEILNKMYGITEEGETLPNQPVFMADPLYSDQMIARAKPSQLAAIQKLVESIDPPIGEGGKYDKNYIQLDYRGKQADLAIELVKDTYSALGRTNKFNVVRSKAAKDAMDRIERTGDDSSGLKQIDRPSLQGIPKLGDGPIPQGGLNENSLKGLQNPGEPKKDSSSDQDQKKSDLKKLNRATTQNGSNAGRTFTVGTTLVQDENKDEVKMRQGEITSVDGAPILIRENAAGLMIISDDLKALAEIKRLLDENEEVINRPSLPTIVELKHRKAIEMKDLLEMFLGLSSGDSGGGGGGLGGLVGGMAQNALGGMAGQMVGGLLGGGTGGGDSGVVASDLLTGDVRIDADALKNVLLIQANSVDLDTIMEYINYFDTDSPDQDPTLDGRTYTIRVNYRDAAELAEVVKNQFPDRIKTAKAQGQSGNNAQAQQMQMLQQLMRGGGRGGRGGGGTQKTVEQSEPKMTVGVDAQMNSILVTGPEFLYQQVSMLVTQLDTPDAVRNGTVVVIGLKGVTPDAVKEALTNMQAETSTGSTTTRRTTGTTTGSPFGGGGATSSNAAADAFRQQMIERFRGGTNRGGGTTGGRGAGGGGRGGGGRGGGGRGR